LYFTGTRLQLCMCTLLLVPTLLFVYCRYQTTAMYMVLLVPTLLLIFVFYRYQTTAMCMVLLVPRRPILTPLLLLQLPLKTQIFWKINEDLSKSMHPTIEWIIFFNEIQIYNSYLTELLVVRNLIP
jgi:hypothetical protein